MMKMATFHGLFWGIALIILGIGLMARFIYNIHFPWFRILIAFVLIYAGLWLLLRPKFDLSGSNLIIFHRGVCIMMKAAKITQYFLVVESLTLQRSTSPEHVRLKLMAFFPSL
jgi:hypothetical protein